MKTPALKFLILRLLEKGPLSGYEIGKKVEEILGHAYPGSIYPLLRWWEERGFVQKRDKYELTEKGRRFLEELEKRRNQYLEMAKKDLLALARALGDSEMEKLVSYLPLREKVGDEGMVLLASVVEYLLRCGEAGRKRLREVLERCS